MLWSKLGCEPRKLLLNIVSHGISSDRDGHTLKMSIVSKRLGQVCRIYRFDGERVFGVSERNKSGQIFLLELTFTLKTTQVSDPSPRLRG